MKVSLIEPNFEGYPLMPTMSLAMLKGHVNEKTNHQAGIIDLIFNKNNWKDYLLERLSKEKPDLVGISVLSFNFHQSLEIAKIIKNEFGTKIILGGVHSILSSDEVIENKNVDMVCIGEGEEVLKELLDANLNPKKVEGIWYKENGKIIKNLPRTLIQDLDSLAFPDWEDFELNKYFLLSNNHLPIMASRGCPYNCTYCSNHALKKTLVGKYVRFRSVDNVIKEIELRIEQYYEKGLKYLFFYDDIFIMHKEFVLEFCKKFKEKGFDKKIKWNANVRANLVTEEIISAMKNAGCYEVRMGVESGNDYIRNDVYKRNMTKEQIDNAIQIIKKNGLQLRLQFIIGAPYETTEMMEESFDLAKQSNADYILFPTLVPLPSTEITDICQRENLIENGDLKTFQDMFSNPVLRTKYTTKKQLKRMAKRIRNYQIRKYLYEGLVMNFPIFLYDLLLFLLYYKPKYKLELDHAFRFTINRYKLAKIKNE